MPPSPVDESLVREVMLLLADASLNDDVLFEAASAICSDRMIARRLIDWIPEAFGFVVIQHLKDVPIMPSTFSAKSRSGSWKEFSLSVEPLFGIAKRLAEGVWMDGPRSTMEVISSRSALLNTVNNAINGGAELRDGVLSGPTLIGIPAEFYQENWRSRLLKLVRGSRQGSVL